eukprot:GHVL01011047.1.p1 GENE.GHVL01011047.1~~GHVL01011047.1.p1  ORF type:complete len:139 (-),score=5.54 GHVL01011047.1:877-1293(-)
MQRMNSQSLLPRSQIETNRILSDYDLFTFRTLVCPSMQSGPSCENGRACKFSHCLTWPRRNPQRADYSPAYCPAIQFKRHEGKTLLKKNSCTAGRKCGYSHTKDEQMYHPFIYKTQLCQFYPRCERGWCPFAVSRCSE